MFVRRHVVKSISALLVAAMLGGCGSQIGDTDKTNPELGGEVSLGLVRVSSLEPWRATTVSERVIADTLYDGLTKWNASSKKTEPSLAQSWTASSDNSVWTFTLRDDAIASNDERITALDVKRSFENVARMRRNSPGSESLSLVDGYQGFVNDPAVPGLSGLIAEGNTLKVVLNAPMPGLPSLLANPVFAVAHFAADGSSKSTGSFKLLEANESQMVFDKAPGSDAYVDKLRVTMFASVEDSFAAFRDDKVDWSLVPVDRITEATNTFGTAGFSPSLRAVYLALNLGSTDVSDVRLRQALVKAIDRKAIVKALGVEAEPLESIATIAVDGAREDACGKACRFDPDAARRLVRDVWPEGMPISIDIALAQGAPFNDASVLVIKKNLDAVGINATVRLLPPGELNAFSFNSSREVFQSTWAASYPKYEAFLNPMFDSASPTNVSNYSNPATDKLLGDANRTDSEDRRLQMSRQLEKQLLGETFAIIPIATFPVNTVAHDRVQGSRVQPLGNLDPSVIWVKR